MVTECDILNRYGFVHMKTEDMAARAIAELDNSEFMGSHISVEVRQRFKPQKRPLTNNFSTSNLLARRVVEGVVVAAVDP